MARALRPRCVLVAPKEAPVPGQGAMAVNTPLAAAAAAWSYDGPFALALLRLLLRWAS